MHSFAPVSNLNVSFKIFFEIFLEFLNFVSILARAKRERVVQDGVEKANRRHGPARPGTPHSLFEN